MIKKFKEFMAELTEAKVAATPSAEHHEANKIVSAHAGHAGTDHEGYHEGDHHFHSHGVHHSKIASLHRALRDAGFKKHEGDHHEPHAGSNHYPPEHPQAHYHRYTKGRVEVNVANHINHEDGHHVVEVVSLKKG